jgi:hypothetical protein
MKRLYFVLSLAGLACTEAPVSSMDIGQLEQGVCANVDGVPSAMAALAVATASELKRWQSTTDFAVQDGFLALSRAGKRRCEDGRCRNTEAILDLQRAPYGEVVIGDSILDSGALRTELAENFAEQQRCEAGGSRFGRCSAEPHELTLASSESGACDTVFTFDATRPSGKPLREPGRLATQLIYAGYPENEYLSFTSTSSTVSIDPTYGLNDSGGTSTGSCSAACVKISMEDISGQCCSCSGVTRSYTRSTFNASTYLCS